MYNASAEFNQKIKESERMFIYSGEIVTTGGTTYEIEGENIRSGKISRAISGDKLEIGTVYASEFDCELWMNVDRYELYGGTITLNIQLVGASDVIPMGIYTIAEINQSMDRLNIKSYDAMTKLDDVGVSAKTLLDVKSPYEWLTQMCTACGLTLGSTSSDIQVLPNANRKTGFADVSVDVKTWRDVLGYLACYLGSYCYIGRDGMLYLSTYKATSDDTITAGFRYKSELSDYRTTYDGIYGVYKANGVQEYVDNTNTGGLVLDLGVNPFLQFTEQANRLSALQEIIDAWNGIYYVPYDSDIPMNPIYDPGDVLTFTGNQADEYDLGVITEITYTLGGQMHVACSGDNPRLASAQDRFTKSIAGLSAEYSNGQEIGGKNFWLLHTENTDTLTVGSTKTQVAEIEWNQTVDVQKMGFMFACDGTLSATANIVCEISVDDNVNYTFPQTEVKVLKGTRPTHSNCGFTVSGKGTHTAKVYLTVTDNPLIWSDLA